MEYQKMINLLDSKSNQQSKFKTKNWNKWWLNSQIKCKTWILKSSLCHYNNSYILVCGAIKVTGAAADDNGRQDHKRNKEVIFKNCARFTDCISEISNTQIDNSKDIHVVMMIKKRQEVYFIEVNQMILKQILHN